MTKRTFRGSLEAFVELSKELEWVSCRVRKKAARRETGLLNAPAHECYLCAEKGESTPDTPSSGDH